MKNILMLINTAEARKKSYKEKITMGPNSYERFAAIYQAAECDFFIEQLTLLLKEETAKDLPHIAVCQCEECINTRVVK